MKINLTQFTADYLTTAAWVTIDSGECDSFDTRARVQAKNDCELFIDKVLAEYGNERGCEILTTPGNDLGYLAPHDFFLTRNRHGAGFWDKTEIYGSDEAKRLTEIAHEFGEISCYHIAGKKSKLTFD